MKTMISALAVGLALCLHSQGCNAAYIISIQQDGADVDVNGGGSLNLAGLQFQGPMSAGKSGDFIDNFLGNTQISIGDGKTGPVDVYTGLSGGELPYENDSFTVTNTNSGAYFFLLGTDSVAIASGYKSGQIAPQSSSVYAATTIDQLGFQEGTFTINLPSDTITYYIGVRAPAIPSPVPLPASAPLFGAGLVALGVAGYAAKRRQGTAAA